MDLKPELRAPLVEAVLLFLDAPALGGAHALLGAAAMRQAPGLGTNPVTFASWVVTFTLTRPTPALFIRVVREVSGGALSDLETLAAALEADPSRWTAPAAGGLWVPEGSPFIDREPVRETLAGMAAGDGPAALGIEGPFGHGKRTIGTYVRKLAEETGGFWPAIVELRREPQPGLLDRIVLELSMAIGFRPDMTPTHREPERQAEVHANRIAAEALGARATVWFVAIVIDHDGLEEGVLRFVDSLLGVLGTSPALARKLRVLVFCEELPLLGLENTPALATRHALTQVTRDEIREWLEAATPGKDPDLYGVTAKTVADSIKEDTTPGTRLKLLATHCAIAQRQLAAMPDA